MILIFVPFLAFIVTQLLLKMIRITFQIWKEFAWITSVFLFQNLPFTIGLIYQIIFLTALILILLFHTVLFVFCRYYIFLCVSYILFFFVILDFFSLTPFISKLFLSLILSILCLVILKNCHWMVYLFILSNHFI